MRIASAITGVTIGIPASAPRRSSRRPTSAITERKRAASCLDQAAMPSSAKRESSWAAAEKPEKAWARAMKSAVEVASLVARMYSSRPRRRLGSGETGAGCWALASTPP